MAKTTNQEGQSKGAKVAQSIFVGPTREELRRKLPRRGDVPKLAWSTPTLVVAWTIVFAFAAATALTIALLNSQAANVGLWGTAWIMGGITIGLGGYLTGWLPRGGKAMGLMALTWLFGLLLLPFVGVTVQEPNVIVMFIAIILAIPFVMVTSRYSNLVCLYREGYKV